MDAVYAAGSASINTVASAAQPVLTLTVSPASSTTNVPTTVTGTLSSSAGVPTGLITFVAEDRGTSSPTQTVNGQASYTFPGFATAGLHTLTASFRGDTIYGNTQATLNVLLASPSQLNKPTLTLTVASTATPGVGFNTSVQASGSSGTPTGRVEFAIDGTTTGSTPLSSGNIVTTLAAPLATGSHIVQATYYGDNNYLSATATASFTVVIPSTGVSVSPGTLSVAYGSTGMGNLTVSSLAGASGTTSIALSLASSSGAAFTGCYNLVPRVLTLPANGTVSAALTMYTTASSCASTGAQPLARTTAMFAPPAGMGRPGRVAWAMLPASLLSLLFFRRRLRQAALLVFIAAGSFGLSGCGSGTSATTTTTTGTGTTTPAISANSGSYVVRVTATTVSGTVTLTSSTTFTLNVQ